MPNILSIDGGGIKGVFPAAFLACIENELDEPLYKYFDLIAGTSSGGIIAIGLSLGMSAGDILEFYESEGPKIFAQNEEGLIQYYGESIRKVKQFLWGSKYNPDALRIALSKILCNQKFGDAKTRLLIPALHAETNRVWLYKTAHHPRFSTDSDELAIDVALATSAAPTYFPKYNTSQGVSLVDGAIWANNPTGVAVVEGVGTLGWIGSEIKVLSIGCLEDIFELPDLGGIIDNYLDLIEIVKAGQSHGSMGIARILTGDVGGANHKAIYRINQKVPQNIYTLDGTQQIDKIKSRAFEECRICKPDLKSAFFQQTAEEFEPTF